MKTNLLSFGVVSLLTISNGVAKAAELFTYTPTGYSAGFMFDIQSLYEGSDLRVHKWWYYFDFNGNEDPLVRLYWRDGTYQGHENSAAGWNLLGEEVVSNKQNGVLRQVPFPTLDIAFGETIGIFTTIINYDPIFLNKVAGMGFRPRPYPQVLENEELRFTGGVQKAPAALLGGDPFGAGQPLIEGHVWSGLISTAPVPEPSTLAIFGIGIGVLALRKRKHNSPIGSKELPHD